MTEHIVIETPPPEEQRCDFCGAHPPVWEYVCHDFQMVDLHGPRGRYEQNSLGGWGACETCHTEIEAGQWDALKARVLAPYASRKSPRDLAILEDLLMETWRRFQQSVVGCKPWEP